MRVTPEQHLPYQTPQPGIPTAWMMLITSCAMKVKKKAMKLKELSVLQEKSQSLPAPPSSRRCSHVSDPRRAEAAVV